MIISAFESSFDLSPKTIENISLNKSGERAEFPVPKRVLKLRNYTMIPCTIQQEFGDLCILVSMF